MPGLIVTDMMGGDALWTVVDDDRWAQIKSIESSLVTGLPRWNDIISYLSSDDTGYTPKGAPTRRGKVIKQFCTQAPVFEDTTLDGIVGILTLQQS